MVAPVTDWVDGVTSYLSTDLWRPDWTFINYCSAWFPLCHVCTLPDTNTLFPGSILWSCLNSLEFLDSVKILLCHPLLWGSSDWLPVSDVHGTTQSVESNRPSRSLHKGTGHQQVPQPSQDPGPGLQHLLLLYCGSVGWVISLCCSHARPDWAPRMNQAQ